jgi:hypothetical protein
MVPTRARGISCRRMRQFYHPEVAADARTPPRQRESIEQLGRIACGNRSVPYSLVNAAMSRAVSRLISGQAIMKISVPCIVPIICRHRAATPASSSLR